MEVKTTKFDPAEYLETQEDRALFIEEAFNTGNHQYMAASLRVALRAKGMREIRRKRGLTEEQLVQFFPEAGSTSLKETLLLLKALGLRLTLKSR